MRIKPYKISHNSTVLLDVQAQASGGWLHGSIHVQINDSVAIEPPDTDGKSSRKSQSELKSLLHGQPLDSSLFVPIYDFTDFAGSRRNRLIAIWP